MYWASSTLCSNTVLPDMLAPVITVGPVVRRMFTGWNRFPAASSEIRRLRVEQASEGGRVLRYRGTGKAPVAGLHRLGDHHIEPSHQVECLLQRFVVFPQFDGEPLPNAVFDLHAAEIEPPALETRRLRPVCGP